MNKGERLFTFLLYILGFLLLWEWLIPLEEVTKTSKTHYFTIFVLLSLLLSFLNAPWPFTWILKGMLLLYALFSIFSKGVGFSGWLVLFLIEVKENTVMLFSRNWFQLSPLYRSFLFFLLLWQITYLLRYWLTMKRKIFVFYLLTILYITLLDTFTEYNAGHAIVRIVVIGFFLLGLLFFKRVLDKEQLPGQSALLRKWTIPLLGMIGLGVLTGYVFPKAGPSWPDPVPFIESKAETIRGGGVSKIGYGADDTQLGGPFVNDDRVVFTALTPKRQYWKIENKDIYTGKGWVASSKTLPDIEFRYGEERPIETILNNKEEPTKASFDFEIVYPHIVRPYGFLSITGDKDGFLRYNPSLEKINSFTKDNREIRLNQYTITFQPASYSMTEMRQTKRMPEGGEFKALQTKYTQLPDALPGRVRELAEEITGDQDNWFDKAKAIERHFQTGEFSYDQTRVSVPTEKEDYVDQFLFDTKRGYCDNFSTSMVVMLRSIGIPARWAKGYAPGKYSGRDGDNRIYTVTNNEAHSWVEVLFPTVGWVPFEPTKGFNNPATYVYDEAQGDAGSPSSNEETTEAATAQNKDKKVQAEKDGKKKASTALGETGAAKFFKLHMKTFLIVLIMLIVIALGLYVSRDRWIPPLLIWNYKEKKQDDSFIDAYESLLKRLERVGLKRRPGQTLRNYAAYVDSHFDTTDMTALTERYERVIYSGDRANMDWEYSRDLWENLIKKTMNGV